MTATTLERLESAEKLWGPTEYTEVMFPMTYSASRGYGFNTPDGRLVWFDNGFTRDGLTYLLYRLGEYVDRDDARDLYYEKDGTEFVSYINGRRGWQETECPRQREKKLIVAHKEGYIHGLLTHYNPVSHASVIQRVKNSPVASRLTTYRYERKEMVLHFRSRFIDQQGNVAFGMAVRNGETGLATLSYNLYVQSQDYEFLIPLRNAKRHLSKVGEVNDNLETIMETAGQIEVDTWLANHTAKGINLTAWLPATAYDKIRSHLEMFPERPLDQLVHWLLTYRNYRGFKVACNKVLDVIFTRAFNELQQ